MHHILGHNAILNDNNNVSSGDSDMKMMAWMKGGRRNDRPGDLSSLATSAGYKNSGTCDKFYGIVSF